jgi:predicted nucleotidyltransferase
LIFLLNLEKTLGIVTEYNPFHNGHLYHIETSKSHTNSKVVVAVMSGHFTQRGEPAIADPWTRATWAIQSGADLVIEIPTIFATSSASYFAYGAVYLLQALGVVDTLCFGSESGNLEELVHLNQTLKENSILQSQQLKSNAHLSYSSQRSNFLETQADETIKLTKSNDILGLSYLEALDRLNSTIEPKTIKRIVSNYHDETLTETISSATAIRRGIISGLSLESMRHTLPDSSFDSLQSIISEKRNPNISLWQEWCLFYLRHTSIDRLQLVHDMPDGLPQRMKQMALESCNYAEFEEKIKTKIYTNGRLKRVIAKMLLGIEKTDLINDCGTNPEYLRILAFNDSGRQLLSRAKPTLPIITNGKHFRPSNAIAQRQWEIDCLAANLYSLLLPNDFRRGGKNYTQPPVYIK